MVVKRQCSFCAQEIEPGTGSMFVKRDGTVFHFCSGSCRKQQLHLGRVGHRFKWTRAYELKRAAERSSAERAPAAPASSAGRRRPAAPASGPVPGAPRAAGPTVAPEPEAAATAAAPSSTDEASTAKRVRPKAPAKSTSKPVAKPAGRAPAKGAAKAPAKTAPGDGDAP